MSTMNWKEPETRSKFLLSVLAAGDEPCSHSKATQIAQYMGCTPKAITHQLTALRKDLEALKNGESVASVTPTTPKSTPNKRKVKDGNDEDGGSASPTKKPKSPTKKKSAKKEVKEGENGDADGSKEESEEAAKGLGNED